MDVQSQLLFIGSSADIKIMVAERARVSRLIVRISTPEGVPHSSYRNERGTIDIHETTPQKE